MEDHARRVRASGRIGLLAFALALSTGLFGADTVVARFDFATERLPFLRYTSRGLSLARPEERTPDGEACLAFTVTTGPASVAHAKEIRFDADIALVSNACYRLSYWAKADGELEFPATVAQANSPWSNYGSMRGAMQATWTRHEAVFQMKREVPRQRISAPFLMPGLLPQGSSFLIGPVRLERIEPRTMVADDAWRPVDMGEHACVYFKNTRIPELEVKPGTALDLSQVLPRRDIDRMGRLVADAQGRLVYEKSPGMPVRLRGFNCTYGGAFDGFQKAGKGEIEEVAEQIRRNGLDVVRLHFWDAKFAGMSGMKFHPLRNTEMEDAGIPRTEEDLRKTLDLEFLDRYHWFVKCLKDRGVYVMFDIATSTAMMVPAGKASAYPRFQLFANDAYRDHWKAAYGVWMNTVNPHTGTRPLDDPQFIGITFFNEQEHLFNPKAGAKVENFTPWFRKECGAARPPLTMALLRAAGEDGDVARAFLRRRLAEMNAFYLDVVRKSGFKGFVTNWDMYMRNLEGDARRDLSAVAMHPYHAHPGHAPRPPDFTGRNAMLPWVTDAETVSRSSSIAENAYLAHASMTRVLGKPFFLTEFSHCGGNRFAQEAPVVQSAAAALQDWQLLAPHADLVKLWHYGGYHPFCFDSGASLMARVASLATAFGWQRGDIARARHAVSFHVPEDVLAGPDYTGTIGSGYNSLVWVTRVGADYRQARNPVADLDVVPTQFASAADMGMWTKVVEEVERGRSVCSEQVACLRAKGILPPGNRTDPSARLFESETGEVVTDFQRQTMTVDAPRFQAAAIKPGTSAKLSQLAVERVSTPASILAISLRNDRPVSASDRLLLVVATRFVAEGSVWLERVWDEAMLQEGGYRQLMKAGRFVFSVKTATEKVPDVYALRMDGTRGERVPCVLRDGRLVFDLDTSKMRFGTPFYEVVGADADRVRN